MRSKFVIYLLSAALAGLAAIAWGVAGAGAAHATDDPGTDGLQVIGY